MEDRRHLLSPLSPSSSQHRRTLSSLPPLHLASSTGFTSQSYLYGSGSVSRSGSSVYPYYPQPLPPQLSMLAPMPGGRYRHTRSLSQPSIKPSTLQSEAAANCFSPLGFQNGTGTSHFQNQLPPSSSLLPLSPSWSSTGGGVDGSSHVSSFSQPAPVSRHDLPSLSDLAWALDLDYTESDEDDVNPANDGIVNQYQSTAGLTAGYANGPLDSNKLAAPITAESRQIPPPVNSLTGELWSGSREKLPAPCPPLAAAGNSSSRQCQCHGQRESMGRAALFELASSMLSEAQLKKVMGEEHLADLMLKNPRKVKRLLAGRKYSAKMSERKARLKSELEQKARMLEREITTLSTRLKWLQSKVTNMLHENNDMMIKIQELDNLGQLKDAVSEALRCKVETLKRATNDDHSLEDGK